MSVQNEHRPRVVIVGAGFGGIAAVKALANASVEVTIIDRRNFHLFQPLLYQVATAALTPSDIALPIRNMLRRQRNVAVQLAEVTGVDTARRDVVVDGRRISFDFLILATGARHAYFGRDEWEPYAPGLKKIDDALRIRRRILEALELAEMETDPAARARLLTFIVIGGGPTGVELAGAIAELAKAVLTKEFRNIDWRDIRVMLIEGGDRVLSTFPERLSIAAYRALERLGVEIRLGDRVTACDGAGIEVAGTRIAAATTLWAAGVAASPAGTWLGGATDRSGRVVVNADLSLPGDRDVFVIGDTAAVTGADGKILPGIAAVAKQQGQYVGRLIRARVDRGGPFPPFRYRHLGTLATIGRSAAVAHLGRIQLSGRLAWFLWGLVHIYFLSGIRNRVTVSISWLWAYVTYQSGSRLIIGDPIADDIAKASGDFVYEFSGPGNAAIMQRTTKRRTLHSRSERADGSAVCAHES